MHPRAEIYDKLCDAFRPMLESGEIKYFDLQKGQFAQQSKSYPVARPALLLRIDRIRYAEMTRGLAEGEANITLQLVIDNRHLSFEGAVSREDSLGFLELVGKVTELATCVEGVTFSDFFLENEGLKSYGHNGLDVYEIGYTCRIHYRKVSHTGEVVHINIENGISGNQ